MKNIPKEQWQKFSEKKKKALLDFFEIQFFVLDHDIIPDEVLKAVKNIENYIIENKR